MRIAGAVRSGRYSGGFVGLQRCDECIERLEELCRAKRLRLAVGHRQSSVARIARLAGAKLQLERRFVHIGDEYASGNERSLVWREIEPRRFLEDEQCSSIASARRCRKTR